jgi:hypothetical protein
MSVLRKVTTGENPEKLPLNNKFDVLVYIL